MLKQSIFQIRKGTCRIEKRIGGHKTHKRKHLLATNRTKDTYPLKNSIVLGQMGNMETFGEIGFLMGGIGQSSVIANDNNVELYIIEGSFINALFAKYPALAGRFYHYISSVLARRLKEQERLYYNENGGTISE